MKVKTILCLVTLGPMTTVSRNVWAWEAEVLKEKFGGQCEFHEEGEAELPKLPEDQLDIPVENPHPLFSTRFGALVFCPEHECLHAGQIALIRRLLGKPPLR